MAELDKYTQKAIDDPEFRKRALEDANKAIKEEFGEKPPYKVTYHVTTPKDLVFCLPPENNELDDAALESASGGVLPSGMPSISEWFEQVKRLRKPTGFDEEIISTPQKLMKYASTGYAATPDFELPIDN